MVIIIHRALSGVPLTRTDVQVNVNVQDMRFLVPYFTMRSCGSYSNLI